MRSLWKAGVAALLGLELLLAGCGDTYRPIVNPITTPTGDPANFDAVVSRNQNPATTAPGSFSQINVSGDILQNVQSVGIEPVAMSFDATRSSMFFANQSSNSITVGSLSSSAKVTINLVAGSNPASVSGLSSGRIYSANTGATAAFGSVPACGNGSVGIIDSTSAVLLTNVCLPSVPVFLLEVPAYQKLYVLSQDGSVRIINTSNGNLLATVLTVGSDPVSALLGADGITLYVLNRGSATISLIDVPTDTVRVSAVPTNGSGPTSFTLDKKLNRLYVANTASNSVSVFDASTNTAANPPTLLRTVDNTGASPPHFNAPNKIAVPSDGSFAYVSNTGSNMIAQINATGFQVSDIPIRPTGMDAATADATVKVTSVTASNDGSKVYASFVEPTDLNNGIAIVRTSTHGLILILPAPLQDVSTCDPSVTGSNCTTLRQRPMELRTR